MNQKKDYYAILGISKDAKENEIRSAYRKLAKKFHPDVSKETNAAQKFKEVQEAYEVLINPTKRSNYDRFGHANEQNYDFGGSGFQGFGNDEFDFGDIFGNFFGKKSQRGTKSNKGQDQHIEMILDFIEAALGVEKKIAFEIEKDCEHCEGTGARTKKDIHVCDYCNGEGYITSSQKTFLGNFTTQQVCPKCNGQGKKILNKCSFCKGYQRVRGTKTLNLNIPGGIDDGETLVSKGQGHEGHLGAPNGDLYVRIKVNSHEFFKRDKQDIISTIFISIFQATLGAVISVPTIDGEINLTIPEGTQNDNKLRLKNKGVPYTNASYRRGDYYVIIKIKTPIKLTKEQKELFRQLQILEENKNNTKKSRFWSF